MHCELTTPSLRCSEGRVRTVLSMLSLSGALLLLLALARPAGAVPACGVAGFGSQTFEIDGDPFCDDDATDGLMDWCPANPDLGGACNPVFNGSFTDIQGVRSFAVDGNSGTPNTEVSIFDGGSNKNNDLIGAGQDPWTEKSGGGFPQKNDITEATIFTFVDDLGDRWMVFSMATRSNNGASHADIEFNIAGVHEEPGSGGAEHFIVGNGPNGGRTPLDTVTNRPRDFILSTDFATGGTVDRSDFFVWQNIGGVYQYATPPVGSVDSVNVFICTNNPTSQPPDGSTGACWPPTGPDGLPATQYINQQWEEFAINLGAFGFTDSLLCGGNSTITFKTRSSPSFTAELKDLLIIPFSIVAPPVCSLDGPAAVCSGETAHVTSTISGGAGCEYEWSIISGSGSFSSGGGTADDFADVTVSGTDTVKVQLVAKCQGCESEPCVLSIFPKPNPTCSVSGPSPVCASSTGNTYTSSVLPAGGAVTYSWSVSGNGTINGSNTNSSVSVDAGAAGSFTVHLDVTRDLCPGSCEKVVTVNANPTCEISGDNPVCASSSGHTYTSSVLPAGGTVTYSWSITGQGSIIGSVSGSSVSVTAGAAGSYTLHLDIVRDGCPGSCEKTVTVNANPTCEISGPSPVCASSTGNTYTSSVLPAGGAVTYSWSITGQGSIVGAVDGSSVSVTAGAAGSFTLHLDVTREGCPGSCEKTVTVNANPTCEISGDNPVCAGSSGHTYTSSVLPAGGTVTYSWSISGDGSIIGSVTNSSVSVTAGGAGSFTLHLDVVRNDCPGSCEKVVTVNANPTCEISGSNNVCTNSTGNIYTSSVLPAGGTVTYSWSITGQGSIVGSVTGSSVNVTAGAAGSFTLHLDVVRNDCPGSCEKTVTVNANATCEISGPSAVCASSTGHIYTVAVSPSGGTQTFSWSISGNGTINGAVDGASVTVDAGATGSFTLHVDVTRDNCPGSCEKTVTVNPNPTCEISGPPAVCAGSSGHTYTGAVLPAGGAVTYSWSISGNGSIIGSVTGSSVSVTAGAAGSFTLHLDVTRESCPGSCEKTVTVNPGPTCEISGPGAVCASSTGNTYTSSVLPPGGAVTYSWSITGQGSIVGAVDGSSVNVTAGAAGSFTLHLDVTREGCTGDCEKTVTVNANPTCEISGDNPVCASSSGHTYTSSVLPAGGTVTYSWSISGNGSIVGSVTGSSVSVTAGAAGSFTLHLDIVRNDCPGSCEKTVTVTANPTCSLDGDTAPCIGQDITYTATVSPSGGSVTYSWSLVPADCGTIVGSNTSSSVVVNWAHGGPCTLHLDVERDGCPGECELEVNPKTCNAEFCTVTQGYWGNAGGYKCFNGQKLGTLDILKALITPGNPLIVGIVGERSVKFNDGSEQCIIDLLPGGGNSACLPDFGDQTIGLNCQTSPALPTNPRTGRIRNVLLAQTITLALNLRFDGNNLCDLELCPYMTTVDANPGPDGCLGNDDDTPSLGAITTFQIPQSVLDFLGSGATVCDLLNLANRVLACEAGLPSPDALNSAVTAINEGFDECRFLQLCGPQAPFTQPTQIDPTRNRLDNRSSEFGVGVPTKFGLFGALPNPTRSMSMVRFALPEASQVHLVLYNIRGQEIKVLVNGVMDQGYKSVGLEMQGLPSGIYLYRLEATGMESGARFRETQKVLRIE